MAVGNNDTLTTWPNLTPDDKRVLAAATGITLAANGTVAQNSNPPGEMPNWGLFIQVNNDRGRGELQGPMTSNYIQALINRTPPDDTRLGDLNDALNFLKARERGAPAGIGVLA
jgi:hypothetical protein